jgi:hypothetical protein
VGYACLWTGRPLFMRLVVSFEDNRRETTLD